MSAGAAPIRRDPGYTGLTRCVGGLPAQWYFDRAHHQRELAQIWYRQWLYVCRGSEISQPRSYHTFEIGDQSVVLVRGADGVARGFHNTCRHRGAALCRETAGRFPAAGIVCPYHAWRYDLQGKLLSTSSEHPPEGFDSSQYALYPISVKEWNGFIYISLAKDPPPFGAAFDQPLDRLNAWHLEQLAVGHTLKKTIGCNWKIFWENYNECLHCPGVHPRLAQLVPLFGRALQDEHDDPRWQDHAAEDDPRYRGGLRADAQSWSMDGSACGVLFPDVSAADRKAGHLYMTCLPSSFIVAHVDYIRLVRLRPLAPELTELAVEFLFLPETLQDPQRDISKAVEFTDIVMSEDAHVCELNQRGLRALPHEQGVLMPEEYMVRAFQDWVRDQLKQA